MKSSKRDLVSQGASGRTSARRLREAHRHAQEILLRGQVRHVPLLPAQFPDYRFQSLNVDAIDQERRFFGPVLVPPVLQQVIGKGNGGVEKTISVWFRAPDSTDTPSR